MILVVQDNNVILLNGSKNETRKRSADRRKNFFFVPVDEIKENNYDLSISKYREIEYEEVKFKSLR